MRVAPLWSGIDPATRRHGQGRGLCRETVMRPAGDFA